MHPKITKREIRVQIERLFYTLRIYSYVAFCFANRQKDRRAQEGFVLL